MSSADASSRLTFVLLIVVIESGAIYSMAIIAALVLFVINSPGVYVILDLVRLSQVTHAVSSANISPYVPALTYHLHRIPHDHRPHWSRHRA